MYAEYANAPSNYLIKVGLRIFGFGGEGELFTARRGTEI